MRIGNVEKKKAVSKIPYEMEGSKCNLISKYHNCKHCAEVFKALRKAT
jgi:hypothetical protein